MVPAGGRTPAPATTLAYRETRPAAPGCAAKREPVRLLRRARPSNGGSRPLVGELLARGAEVDGCPATERSPRLRDLGQVEPGTVEPIDLLLEPPLVLRQHVRGVGAPNDDELGRERPETLDLLHGVQGLVGLDRAQRRAVQATVQGRFGEGP